MAEKSVKKVSTKKPAVKKVVSKPEVAKKAVAKKPAVKKPAVKKSVAAETVVMPVADAPKCCCEKSCACKCHHRGFFKKFILFLIIFALGFVAANMICGGKPGRPGPRFDENGCLVKECPKIKEMKSVIDVDGNNCITRAELDAARPMMHAPQPVAE